ncbi:MAG: nicotinate-nucleotide--dimethylbenzimidazole phosphoribosyltransferase [Thermoleophilia bacterium]|nr:nicotinate-nucleotide--dimethylbenzimidazole phosphoribosyltransferase [Thermoleophilia bacterium]
MEKLKYTLGSITPLDTEAMRLARARQDQLTKPPGSLGILEELSIRMAGIQANPLPQVGKKVIIVMAGDHGVVAEGVSAYPQEVTPQMVANFAASGAGINVLARHAGAEVRVVDMGVAAACDIPGVIQKKICPGTANMTMGPAMSREEAIDCLIAGIEIAEGEIAAGADLLGTGDMGIGNTTPASAILTMFSGASLEHTVGRGTGIGAAALEQKREAVRRALEINDPDPGDGIDVLAKVGGAEIGGLAGVILGAAAHRVPVVIDGFISSAAALIAASLSPASRDYMIASHVSIEPGHKLMLEELGLKPMLFMNMRLGEGTGAALASSLVEAACKVLCEMATFAEAGVAEKDEEKSSAESDQV